MHIGLNALLTQTFSSLHSRCAGSSVFIYYTPFLIPYPSLLKKAPRTLAVCATLRLHSTTLTDHPHTIHCGFDRSQTTDSHLALVLSLQTRGLHGPATAYALLEFVKGFAQTPEGFLVYSVDIGCHYSRVSCLDIIALRLSL